MPREYVPSHQTTSPFTVKPLGETPEVLRTKFGWMEANFESEVFGDLKDVARAWQAASRAAAPVRTGELRRSISVRALADRIVLNATARHAGWVHFGTKWQPAQPFVQEGWQAIGGQINPRKAIQRGKIHRRVNEASNKAFGKAGITVT